MLHPLLRPAAAVGCALLLACATAPQPRDTGLLVFWEVESATHPEGRAWLLGSVHMARPDLQLDPRIAEAFRASDALVLEFDATEAQAGPMQKLLAEHGVLPEGQTARDALGSERWERLAAFFEQRGIPPAALSHYQPWVLLTIVTTTIVAESGAQQEAGIEMQLLQQVGDKKVVSLESVEFQIELMRTMPGRLVARMLDAMLEHVDETRASSALLLDAWEAGDLELLERLTLGEDADDPDIAEFHERTYYARNRVMAERLDELLARPATWFVAVGAGHMAGSQGLPALLEGRGHRVTRVPREGGP